MLETIKTSDILNFEEPLKNTMLRKLDKTVKWNYCTFLPGSEVPALTSISLGALRNCIKTWKEHTHKSKLNKAVDKTVATEKILM